MNIDNGKSRHVCHDPVRPDLVWKPSGLRGDEVRLPQEELMREADIWAPLPGGLRPRLG